MEKDRFFTSRVKLQTKAVPFELLPPFPKNLMLELTNDCNQSCSFCGNPRMQRPRTRMDPALAESVLEQARELGAEESGFYTTGESMLHEAMEDLVAVSSRLGYRYIYLSTNGSLLVPDRARALVNAGMNSINFMISAGTPETYRQVHGQDHFARVQANLDFLLFYRQKCQKDFYIFITYVIVPENMHELEILPQLYGNQVDEIYFVRAHAQPQITPSPLSQLKRFATTPCHMLFNRVHVSCEGYLTLCSVDMENYLAVADLGKMSLKEAWESEPILEMRRRHLEGRLEGTLCAQCISGDFSGLRPLDSGLAGRE